MKINREELAWAAGFFDGEGYVGIRDNKKDYTTRPTLKVSSTDRDMIERFQYAVGGIGCFRGPIPNGGLGKKPIYEWFTRKFEHVQAVIAMLYPFMCSRRKARMKECLLLAPVTAKNGALWGTYDKNKEQCIRGHNLAETRYINVKGACSECARIRARIQKQKIRKAHANT